MDSSRGGQDSKPQHPESRNVPTSLVGHFLPSEYSGYADAFAGAPGEPDTHPEALVPADTGDERPASAPGGTGFQLPVVEDGTQIPDHAQERHPEAGAAGATDGGDG
jgi:hypothetical protein